MTQGTKHFLKYSDIQDTTEFRRLWGFLNNEIKIVNVDWFSCLKNHLKIKSWGNFPKQEHLIDFVSAGVAIY